MKFSIVTPSFNQLELLELCIRSVADQLQPEPEFQPSEFSLEHLILDGGSVDWIAFQNRLEAENREVKTGNYELRFRSEPDEGMYDALNRGFDEATGDLLGWLNCDEQYLPGTLASVAEEFRNHPDLDFLFGGYVVVDGKWNYRCSRHVVIPQAAHTALCHLNTMSCSMFFRRRVIEDWGCRFDPEWKMAGDAEWMLRCLKKNPKMKAVSGFLALQIDTGENLTYSDRSARERERLAEESGFSRWTTPLVAWMHRARKWMAGCYRQSPFTIPFYQPGKEQRRSLSVERPTTRWRNRWELMR